ACIARSLLCCAKSAGSRAIVSLRPGIFLSVAMSDWRLLLWGNWFQHSLFLATSKKREGTVHAVEPVQKLAAPASRGRSSSVRAIRAVPPHLFTGSITKWRSSELFHRNGTLMQDLRQHAGVTGREEIRAIIGPCRCSEVHSAYYN